MPTPEDWRVAFARQARADLAAREQLLANPAIPACQQFHFLQMACEKICKANLFRQGSAEHDLRQSHAYIAKQLPLIAREQLSVRGKGEPKWFRWAMRRLARQIELLAPAVDDGGRHAANCEYPWVGAGGRVMVPASYDFGVDLQREPAGRMLMKILYAAIAEASG
ncbi:MAG TPA: hypothetical protein P5572_06545 [Phycisphaerae bacterium]|nr:hypothetical protein [Phycisphaerae bacterium]